MKKAFTVIEALVVIAIVLILAAILFPIFARSGHGGHKTSCQSNLKQTGLGLLMYTQDYDEKYPRAAWSFESSRKTKEYPDGVYGWADVIQPYIKSTQIYQCPEDTNEQPKNPDPQKIGYTDYWYNSRLADINFTKIKKPISVIMAGDGNDGSDLTGATYSYGSLPGAWIKSKTSPAYRHLDGANYLFADGHVKRLPPTRISVEKPNGENATFRIQ
jgi:prepilin-type processing-associated H-X9-DG protein/prepilin-type N-terminal cleavage/methylation domain-containing protein